MVAVAIVGILAAIAYPSYDSFIRSARRADAQRALEEAAQFMRRRYTSADTHVGAQLPGSMQQSPAQGNAAYQITLVEAGRVVRIATVAHAFELRAVRTGAMAGDRCGDLNLTHTGAKALTGAAKGATLTDCFRGN